MTALSDSPGTLVVGVADLAIASASQHRALVTFGLGSCIGVTAHDPVAGIGGLLHYMLPQPPAIGGSSRPNAALHASTGIALLVERLIEAGAKRPRLVTCAAGAAEILHRSAGISIGEQNRTALLDALAAQGIRLADGDFGGHAARTLSLDLSTGEVRVRSRDQKPRIRR